MYNVRLWLNHCACNYLYYELTKCQDVCGGRTILQRTIIVHFDQNGISSWSFVIWELWVPKPLKRTGITNFITGTVHYISIVPGNCVCVSHWHLNHQLHHRHCALVATDVNVITMFINIVSSLTCRHLGANFLWFKQNTPSASCQKDNNFITRVGRVDGILRSLTNSAWLHHATKSK